MLTLLLALVLGCHTSNAECSEDTPCGFGAVCVAGVCQTSACATSDQCGIEQYCDGHSCKNGCQLDTDCKFGDVCDVDSNQCVSAQCSDTRLDCGFGQFCSPAGECYDAAGYYCHGCNDDGDCGGNGNICLSGTCGVTCQSDADCPGGFDCYPVSDFAGNVVSHQCWTDCSRWNAR